MARSEVYANDALVESWEDTATERITTNADGTISRRALTPEEVAANEATAQADARMRNTDSLTTQVRSAIDGVLASRETLRAIVAKANNQITAGDTKQIARELMRSQKDLIAVLRLIGGALDSSNTGAD